MENRIGNLEDKFGKLEQCKERHDERLDALERKQLEMLVGYNKDFELIFKKLESIELILNLLKEKPAKKWEHVEIMLISGIVGAVVSYTMIQIGFLG